MSKSVFSEGRSESPVCIGTAGNGCVRDSCNSPLRNLGQRLFGKFKQLPETIDIHVRVPNQSLWNAGLNERDAQRRTGRILFVDSGEPKDEQRHDHDQRQSYFRLPRHSQGGAAEDHAPGGKQRQRNPHDQKRNAINAGDRGDLNERNQLILRRAQRIPWKPAEQPPANHFQRHPGSRARKRP